VKRAGRLLERIATRENVAAAYWQAARGKRRSAGVLRFAADFDGEIQRLVRDLADGTWQPGAYQMFQVRDPKLRVIHAAPFRDRVAHHALMRICAAPMERGAMPQSYACRIGRGSHAAVRDAAGRARAGRFFLKLDVRRYFDSICHARLEHLLRRVIKDGPVLDLLGRIIASHGTAAGPGLPIGTLTSQYFANFFLDGMDRWIISGLGCTDYVRYMDDFVLWHDDAARLREWGRQIGEWLDAERGLGLKQEPEVLPCREGMEFLGYRVLPGRILMARKSRRRFVQKLRANEAAHEAGRITGMELQRRVDALLGWLKIAACQTWRGRVCHGQEVAG
jgi:RNA-directed DNA polymerase